MPAIIPKMRSKKMNNRRSREMTGQPSSLITDFLIPGLLLLLAAGGAGPAQAQLTGDVDLGGYIQGNPVLMAVNFPETEGGGIPGNGSELTGKQVWMEYRLQNRLNVGWNATSGLSVHWQMRTRLFAGDLVREVPGYAEGIGRDGGLLDLSWMVAEDDSWLLHYITDRLYGEWDRGDWNIRAGRQRVNWGVNMTTNPNDLFNIYSIYDFDYPERPGSDALRIQRFFGFNSRMELAVNPSRDPERSVAALLYDFHTRGYDIQLIGGYYRERIALGAGWAGDVRGAGVKGETMYYAETRSGQANQFIAAVSGEYMLNSRLFLVGELLYNHRGGRDAFELMAGQLTPHNPSFSRYQATVQASYPFTPLLDGSLAGIYYPDEQAVFLSPSVTWSVIEDMDLQLLGQVFAGGTGSVFATAGNLVTGSLKYHF